MGYNIDAQRNAGNSTYNWALCRYSEIMGDKWVFIYIGLSIYYCIPDNNSSLQFKPEQWNDTTFRLFYNKAFSDSRKCLKIMHDLTDSVIRDRKAEYR